MCPNKYSVFNGWSKFFPLISTLGTPYLVPHGGGPKEFFGFQHIVLIVYKFTVYHPFERNYIVEKGS